MATLLFSGTGMILVTEQHVKKTDRKLVLMALVLILEQNVQK